MDKNYTTMGRRAVKAVVGGAALAGIGAVVTSVVGAHLVYETFRGTDANSNNNIPEITRRRQGGLMDRLASMYQSGYEQ